MTDQEKMNKCNEAIVLLKEMFGEEATFQTHVTYESNEARYGVHMFIPGVTDVLPGAYLDRLPENCTVKEFADYAADRFQTMMKDLKEVRRGACHVDMSREGILKNVILQALGQERNQGLLKKNLHMRFLDLAGVYRMPVESDQPEHRGLFLSALIPNELQERYHFDLEELFEVAKKNTLEKYGIQMFNDREVMMKIMAGLDFASWQADPFETVRMDRPGLYVITNRNTMNGSALMLIPEILEALGEKAGSDYFILPSSIHEFRILRDDGRQDKRHLKKSIRLMNRDPNCVKPRDVLSDSLYRYSRKKKELSIV